MLVDVGRFSLALCVVCAILLAGSAAAEPTQWPAVLDYSIGVSTDSASRLQLSAALSGPVGEDLGAKVSGWWVLMSDDNRAFLADAYLDYDRSPLYLALGRKHVVVGPAGVLVSPGVYGGEARVGWERLSLQALAGRLAFTPVTGGTRFTYAGARAPSDEGIRALRAALEVSEPGSARPAVVGLNLVDLLDDTGRSLDISVAATEWMSFFAEAARYGGVRAHAYGVRVRDQRLLGDPTRDTVVVLYHRKIPVGFVPAPHRHGPAPRHSGRPRRRSSSTRSPPR